MDVIKLAREAGGWEVDGKVAFYDKELQRFTDLVLEEAAKVCESKELRGIIAGMCAAAIRQMKHNVTNIDK